MEIIYDEALPKDARDLIDYLNIVAGQTNNLLFGANECTLTEVEEMQLIQEIHEDLKSVMIVARDCDKIVGVGSLNGNKQSRIKHRASIGVSVLKDYWHQGIGSDLMSALIGYAIEADIEIIDLEVITTNKNAIALYQKFGFEVIGTYKNFIKINDNYFNGYIMNLYL